LAECTASGARLPVRIISPPFHRISSQKYVYEKAHERTFILITILPRPRPISDSRTTGMDALEVSFLGRVLPRPPYRVIASGRAIEQRPHLQSSISPPFHRISSQKYVYEKAHERTFILITMSMASISDSRTTGMDALEVSFLGRVLPRPPYRVIFSRQYLPPSIEFHLKNTSTRKRMNGPLF
jgi:hypothetical protein